MQSLAPESAAQRHAETDTGPHGLSSIQRDAVQQIIRECLEARDVVAKANPRQMSVFALCRTVGNFDKAFENILEECRRLT